ncbi:MAG: YqgE/AlgH family protein [bacterium]|nr:YqgE/AlgH family protein [bacterium]
MESKKASFLIAMPSLQESLFSKSLILMAEHHSEGALGFIVNHDTGANLAQALRLLDLSSIDGVDLPLLLGGPVQTDFFWLLHEPSARCEGTMLLNQEVYLSPASSILALPVAERPLIFQAGIGYAGWGPGQLDREIVEGSWWEAELDLKLLFETPLEKRWPEAFESLGAHVQDLIDPGDTAGPIFN